jgi:hypothetical protein
MYVGIDDHPWSPQIAPPQRRLGVVKFHGIMTVRRATICAFLNVRTLAACIFGRSALLVCRVGEEALKEFSRGVPIGRIGRPEEIAEAALYFASEESAT